MWTTTTSGRWRRIDNVLTQKPCQSNPAILSRARTPCRPHLDRASPPGSYGTEVPDFASAADWDDPPALPSHLLSAALNAEPYENDPAALPRPVP